MSHAATITGSVDNDFKLQSGRICRGTDWAVEISGIRSGTVVVRTYFSSNSPREAEKEALAKKVILFVKRKMEYGWLPWAGVLEYEDYENYAECRCEEPDSVTQRNLALSLGRIKSRLFIQVVRDCLELPEEVRTNATNTHDVAETIFDQTYIEFLDSQIQLNPRGSEWTAMLRRRREGLLPYCGVRLLSGHIRVGRFVTWVKVDPTRKAVIFWEQLEDDNSVA